MDFSMPSSSLDITDKRHSPHRDVWCPVLKRRQDGPGAIDGEMDAAMAVKWKYAFFHTI